MDAYKIVSMLIILAWCGLSHQTPVDTNENTEQMVEIRSTTTEIPVDTTQSDPTPSLTLGIRCATARGVAGQQDCEHNTAAIDLTLFATRGYIKPCSMEEVCCPFQALVKISEVTQPIDEGGNTFDFNEDD